MAAPPATLNETRRRASCFLTYKYKIVLIKGWSVHLISVTWVSSQLFEGMSKSRLKPYVQNWSRKSKSWLKSFYSKSQYISLISRDKARSRFSEQVSSQLFQSFTWLVYIESHPIRNFTNFLHQGVLTGLREQYCLMWKSTITPSEAKKAPFNMINCVQGCHSVVKLHCG